MSAARIVAVLGANGQLGSDVCEAFARRDWRVVPLTQDDLDLEHADAAAIEAALGAQGAPAAVVNAAAYTNVDKAESDAARAFAINGTAVRNIARASGRLNALLIHTSTDYVFDGAATEPYTEDDLPGPLQVYGATKLAGEYFARAESLNHAVVRSSGLYGTHACIGKGGDNFVRKVLARAREQGEADVVDDEFAAPTYTVDLAAQLERIAAAGATGLFHATAHGAVSWFEFAEAAIAIAGVRATLRRTTAARFKSIARRPPYSALANARLATLGLDKMPDWKDGLTRYLRATHGTG